MAKIQMGGRAAGKAFHGLPYKKVTAIVQFNHEGMEKVLKQDLGKNVQEYVTPLHQHLPKEPTKVVLLKNHYFYKYFCKDIGNYVESPINPADTEFVWFTVIMEKEE